MEMILECKINPADICTAQQKGARIVGKHIMFYTKKEVLDSNNRIRKAICDAIADAGFSLKGDWRTDRLGRTRSYVISENIITRPRPIFVGIRYCFPFTSANTKKEIESGEAWMFSRPDIDNLTKSVLDMMGDIKIFEDDAQICSLSVSKIRCGNPHIDIVISTEMPRSDYFFDARLY